MRRQLDGCGRRSATLGRPCWRSARPWEGGALVQAAAALNDPVPLPEAVRGLLRFLMQTTHATDAALVVRSYDPTREPAENYRAYDAAGSERLALVPFARSVAGTATSMQEPSVMNDLAAQAASGAIELQPFERQRTSLLAAPLLVIPGVQIVFELFDKRGRGGFTLEDMRLAASVADFGVELLRQALAERQSHTLLLDAVGAALGASEHIADAARHAGCAAISSAAVLDTRGDAVCRRARRRTTLCCRGGHVSRFFTRSASTIASRSRKTCKAADSPGVQGRRTADG